jgi:hypothetical protein
VRIPAERGRKVVAMTVPEHDSAVRRLEAALEEQHRSHARYDAAIGTSSELAAYTALRVAGEEVSARDAWLKWVDDEEYRGLNAGPFALRAESSERRRGRWPRDRDR